MNDEEPAQTWMSIYKKLYPDLGVGVQGDLVFFVARGAPPDFVAQFGGAHPVGPQLRWRWRWGGGWPHQPLHVRVQHLGIVN